MGHTNYYHLLGDSHIRGNAAGEPGAIRPLILGPAETMFDLLDLPPTDLPSLAVNDILEQIPFGISIRARVVRIISNSGALARCIVETVAGDAVSGQYPGDPPDDPSFAWDTYTAMNRNGAPASFQIVRVTQSQTIEQLNDPDLAAVSAQTVFWDPKAKPARYIDVSNYTHTNNGNIVLPGDRLTTSGGAVCIVVGVVPNVAASTARIYIALRSGTLTVGHTLTNDQALRDVVGTCAITAVGPVTTAGTWVNYCATPSLNRRIDATITHSMIGNTWEVPPNGNAMKGDAAGIGPDCKLVKNAVAYHQRDPDTTKRGVRLLTYSSNDDSPAKGYTAGVTLQRVEVSGLTGTWTAGATITAGTSGWSAVLAGRSGSVLYVHSTNGITLTAAETLTASSGGTATSTGAAFGWRKGSKFWNDWVAYRATAAAATGALEGGQAAIARGVFLMIWEGEVSPFAQLGSVDGVALLLYALGNAKAMREQWVDFLEELRTELGVADLPVSLWVHHQGSQGGIGSGGGLSEGVVTYYARELLKSVATFVEGVTIVDSQARGHQMQYATGNPDLYLRTLDYLDLGNAFWHLLLEPTLAAPIGDFRVLPIVVVAGSQSQMFGFNRFVGGIDQFDKDPDLWPSATFLGVGGEIIDTRDPNLMVWNHAVEEIQVLDVAQNENTFWQTGTTNPFSGPCTPIMQRFKMRFGDGGNSAPILLFKAAVSGSCYNPNQMVASGCWSPTLVARPTILKSVTVSHVTAGATNYARFTGTAGTFSSIAAGSSIVIGGSSGVQNAGGNNTPPFGFNSAAVVAGDGSYIDVPDSDGTKFTNGTETLSFAIGPPPIWPTLAASWKKCLQKVVEAGYIPQPVCIITEQGESDLAFASEYATQLDALWSALIDLCALRGSKKDIGIAKCLVQVHRETPYTTNPAQIETLRAAQAAKAASLADCVLLDPSGLPFTSSDLGVVIGSPPFPRKYRLENGVHHSGFAMVTKGFLIDQALGRLTSLIPAHPRGDVQLFGAVNNGATLEIGGSFAPEVDSFVGGGGSSLVDVSSDKTGSSSFGPGDLDDDDLVVEDGSGYSNADTYTSVDEADAVLASYGTPATWTAATRTVKAQALRRATREWLEGVHQGIWRGAIQSSSQRLSWPRSGAYDDEGRSVSTNTIPWQIVHAIAIVAADVVAGGVILPTGYERGAVLRETKKAAGFERTTEYGAGSDGDSTLRRQRDADALIYPFATDNGGIVSRA